MRDVFNEIAGVRVWVGVSHDVFRSIGDSLKNYKVCRFLLRSSGAKNYSCGRCTGLFHCFVRLSSCADSASLHCDLLNS